MNKKTLTYKTVFTTAIEVDLFYKGDINEFRPVIIWLHGGGLVSGGRHDIEQEQLALYLENGFKVLCFDYQLAPSSKIDEIHKDIKDAITWTIENNRLIAIDKNNINLVGHSAGGYLSIFAANNPRLPIKKVVSIYGYADITSEWTYASSSTYSAMKRISEDEAMKKLRKDIVANVSFKDRFEFYIYTRQTGRWREFITGYALDTPEAQYEALSPLKNIQPNYPPILLVHGTMDNDVPFSESQNFADALEEQKLELKLIPMNGSSHMFDKFEGGFENKKIKEAFDEIIQFLKA